MVPKKWFPHLYIGIFSLIMISESYDIFIFSSDIFFCNDSLQSRFTDSGDIGSTISILIFFSVSLQVNLFYFNPSASVSVFFLFFLLNLLSLKMVFVLSSKIEKTQNEMILECSLLPSGHQ